MIRNVRHTGLVVRDLEKSLKFYRDLLGLEVIQRKKEESEFIDKVVGLKNVCLEWIKLKAPDASVIELLQYYSHPEESINVINFPANKLGCSHIAFTVDDIESFYKNLCAQGYKSKNPPSISPDNSVKVLYCYDSDGIIVEIVEELNKVNI